jgi:predicted transcriptional regulator
MMSKRRGKTEPPREADAPLESAESINGEVGREARRHRVEMLAAARNAPVSVPPDAPVSQAITLMLTNDFSQIPVMRNERDAKGLVSWKSIGTRQALGRERPQFARDVMEHVELVSIKESLFTVIPLIARQDCVLVRDNSKLITGIVTAFDISEHLQQFAEPFWRLEDLENYVRLLLDSHLVAADFEGLNNNRKQRGLPEVTAVDDLTFGDYVELVATHWERFGLSLDQSKFIAELRRANQIRNQLMHFRRSTELGETDRLFLLSFSRLLGRMVRSGRRSQWLSG